MQNNNSNQAAVSKVTWQLSLKWGGVYRTSPEYSTIDDCLKAQAAFMEQFQGKFLSITVVRNVKYTTEG